MLSQRALEAFREVMRCGTVSAAAAELNVSQPAISRHIRELEASLGMPLFIRHGGRIAPTQEAQEFWSEVERSMISLKHIERAAQQIKRGQRATLAVAAAPVFALTLLPDVISIIEAARPDMNASVLSMTTLPVARQVTMRQCQIGFVVGAHRQFDVDLLTTGTLPFRLIAPAKHRFGELDHVTLDHLAGETLVGFEETTLIGRTFERHFARMARPPVIRFRSYLSHIVSALVLRGLGAAIVDPLTARQHGIAGGISRPFAGDDRFEYAVLKARGERLSADGREFVDAFETVVDGYR